jgi:hypothetical protein
MDMEAGRPSARKPVYKQWWFWPVIIGALVVLGVGSFLVYWLVFHQTEVSGPPDTEDSVPSEQASYEKCKMDAVEKFASASKDAGGDAAKGESARVQFIKDLNKCIEERKDTAFEFLDILQEEMKCGDGAECDKSYNDHVIDMWKLHNSFFYQLLSEAATTDDFFEAIKSKTGFNVPEADKSDWVNQALWAALNGVRSSKSASTFAKAFERHKVTHNQIKGDAKVVAKVAESVGKAMDELKSKSEPAISLQLILNASIDKNLKSFIKRAKAIKDVQLVAKVIGYLTALDNSVSKDQVDFMDLCKDHDDSKFDEKPLNAAWERYKENPDDDAEAREFVKQIVIASFFFASQVGKRATV